MDLPTVQLEVDGFTASFGVVTYAFQVLMPRSHRSVERYAGFCWHFLSLSHADVRRHPIFFLGFKGLPSVGYTRQ